MSKIISDLHNLNDARKKQGDIVVEDNQEDQEQVSVVREHKGIFILSFLLVVLIGISAFSMSISLKTFAQLETSWAYSKVILQTLSEQVDNIENLKLLIADNTSEELAQISKVNDQFKELKVVMKDRKQEQADIKVAHNNLKTSMLNSLDELKAADDLILKKFTLLNDKVNDTLKYNSTFLSTY